MMRLRHRLVRRTEGSAAAEMALLLPLLLILLYAPFELGYYFMSEHVVQKGVRDAARYAARLPLDRYPLCVPTAAAEAEIQRVARAGDPDGDYNNDGVPDQRLTGWTSDGLTTVTMTCDTSGTYSGIYDEFPDGVPVVTVNAAVPYPTLFGMLGLGTASLTLNARSQSAVFGA